MGEGIREVQRVVYVTVGVFLLWACKIRIAESESLAQDDDSNRTIAAGFRAIQFFANGDCKDGRIEDVVLLNGDPVGDQRRCVRVGNLSAPRIASVKIEGVGCFKKNLDRSKAYDFCRDITGAK